MLVAEAAGFPHFPRTTELPIATKRNTYAKRHRDQEKKNRLDVKRAKREQKKLAPKSLTGPDEQATEQATPDEQAT
ncbi:MAG: hypothetical protein EXS05_09375 [Planctomycetaceae bacterium]|nr:hypothetical protein [Planctomycetaceae bacterium]